MDDLNQKTPVNYELTFLIKDENSLSLKEEFTKSGAVLSNERPLQKIKLAYPIKKTVYGFMGAFNFVLTPDKLADLNAKLKLDQSLLRYSLNRALPPSEKQNFEPGLYMKAREERKRPIFVKEPVKTFEPVLTNEALEKKIDELK